ncbi:13936_t:CDS:2, partial [Cetraspora pellucida]
NNEKTPIEDFNEFYNHQCKLCFANIIGFFYKYGIGTAINYSGAFDIYNQASKEHYFDHNHFFSNNHYFINDLQRENQIIGLISLGILYADGKVVEVNKPKAISLFLKSVAKGTSVDDEKAFAWYIKSAEDGDSSEQKNLGECYKNGIGNFRNYIKALKWFMKSYMNGNKFGE